MDEVVTVLSTEECWETLRGEEFGRLAYVLGDEVDIVPVNYAVDDPAQGPSLLFRTAEGSKLLAVLLHPQVVFEIDRYDEKEASSVIVRGQARRLEEDEAHRAEQLPLRRRGDPAPEALSHDPGKGGVARVGSVGATRRGRGCPSGMTQFLVS
jgi:nitroimidazol reductase NimA-like FMN-containing flavoprotein (pyridoxamine 5'-phosphate oxidase superfamily)